MGHFLGSPGGCQEQAAASLALGAPGCLFAELAASSPGAAGCNYALQLQRKCLAGRACAGPGCTLAAGLQGTKEPETSGRGEHSRSRTRCRQAEIKKERVRDAATCAWESLCTKTQDPHSGSQQLCALLREDFFFFLKRTWRKLHLEKQRAWLAY